MVIGLRTTFKFDVWLTQEEKAMKTTVRRGLATAAMVVFALVLFQAQQVFAGSITLSFDPQHGFQRVGDNLFVSLNANVPVEDAFVAFGLNINNDFHLIHALDATLNPTLFPPPQLPPVLGIGFTTLTGFVPVGSPPVSGMVNLGMVEFHIDEPGSSELTLSFDGPTQGFVLENGDIIIPD